ncbi:MAG: ABC transporter substrate-binding protein [Chitinophagales bacterium]
MNQLSKLLFPLLIVFILLSACGSDNNSGNNTGEKANAKLTAATGGVYYGGIFRMNEDEYLRSLYPLNIGEVVGHRIANQIYEGLVMLNQETLTIEPAIAESWTVNEDATQYTFTIRKGVKFHNDECFEGGKGREVTARDVKYCLDRLCSYATDNKGYDFVKDRIIGAEKQHEATEKGQQPEGGVEGVKVIDDYTIQISLQKPFSSFLHILAMPFGYVFPQEAVEKYGLDMRSKTVGTGPFYLKRLSEDEAVILLKNPNYWGMDENGNQLPYLDGIRFSFIKDQMAGMLEFKNGNIDMVYRLPLQLSDEIVDRNGKLTAEYSQFQFQEKAAMSVEYYGFLNTGEMFKNKLARQAFCYAIDRQKIVDFTLKGAGVPGNYGIVPPSFANYDATKVKGYEYNPDKARRLLGEAGFPNGKGFPKATLQINSGGTRNEQVAEAIQKMISETLNIDIDIIKMPFAQHLENTEAGKFNLWRAGWIADYPDPENFLNLLWGAHLPEDPSEGTEYLNTFRYRSETFDKLFEEALRTVDDAKRMELYQQANQTAINDAPLLPIYYNKDRRLLQPYVRNFPQNAMEYRNLRSTHFVPDSDKVAAK